MLTEQEAGGKADDICRRHAISQMKFYAWLQKNDGLEVSDARRLKALEEENVRLKPTRCRLRSKRCCRVHPSPKGKRRFLSGRKVARGLRCRPPAIPCPS